MSLTILKIGCVCGLVGLMSLDVLACGSCCRKTTRTCNQKVVHVSGQVTGSTRLGARQPFEFVVSDVGKDCTILFKSGKKGGKERVRMDRIIPLLDDDPAHKTNAAQKLREKLKGKMVRLERKGWKDRDAAGCLHGEVFLEKENINQWMVTEGLAQLADAN